MKNQELISNIYDYISEYIKKNAYSPTVRDISSSFNISVSTAYGYLKKLEASDMIHVPRGKRRSIELSNAKRPNIREIPLLGKITAGTPIEAIQSNDETFLVSEDFFPGTSELFMLKVEGDSMIDAGIFDGDMIIARKQATAQNGQIAVVLIDELEATVKRVYFENNALRLHPENTALEDIIVENGRILGIVTGLLRNRI